MSGSYPTPTFQTEAILAGGSVAGTFSGNPVWSGSHTFQGATTFQAATTHQGTSALNGATTVGTSSAAATWFSNGPAGSRRVIQAQTAGSNRWRVGANTTAEGGSNAGTDWDFDSFTDAGGFNFTAMRITRSTGKVTAFKGVQIGSGTFTFDGTALTNGQNQPTTNILTMAGTLATPTQSSGINRWIYTDNATAGAPTGFARSMFQMNYAAGAGSVGAGIAFDLRGSDVATGSTGDRAAGQGMGMIAIRATTVANHNQGGTTNTDTWGTFWGANIVCNANTGATFLNAIRGVEINIGMDTGTSAGLVEGLKITQTFDNQAAVNGTVLQVMGGGQSSTVAPVSAIRIGWNPDIAWTFDANTSVIDSGGFGNTFPSSAGSQQCAYYINAWGVDHQQAFARAPGPTGPLLLDGSGCQIGTTRLVPSSAGLAIDAVGAYGTGTPTVAAGGSGYVIGDRLFYGNGGVCQVATVSGGAVLTVRAPLRQPYLTSTSTPGNPLATTVDYRSAGSGCTLNVSWVTTAVGLSLQPTSGGTLSFFGAALAAKSTGWAAMTGTPDKSTAFATSTVTLAQLAGRVMSIQAQLTTYGLLNA